VLAQIAGMIETVGLRVGAGRLDFGNGRLRQDLCGDIVDG
jgi:hypothetical protein